MTASLDNDSCPELHVCQHVVVPLTERLRVPGVDGGEQVGGRGFDDAPDVTRRSMAAHVYLVILPAAESRQPVQQLVVVDRHLWAERSALGQDEGNRAGVRPISELRQQAGRLGGADDDLIATLPDCLATLWQAEDQAPFIIPVVSE